MNRPLAITDDVLEALTGDCVVAIAVSGGKDSQATALAVTEYLDTIGHQGERILIHSDLGVVEWRESLPTCQRLAEKLGLELMVVRREAGDLMDRWEQRWASCVKRYAELECMKLILPWSTPALRYCQSELKAGVLSRALTTRFPGRTIVSPIGIRRQESSARAKQPVSAEQERMRTRKCRGISWHPIIEWTKDEVLSYIAERGVELHHAYTEYGTSRVSCAFCIMSSAADMRAAANCAENAGIYRRMVDLEILSTFAFQGARWLGDVAPELLDHVSRAAHVEAKARAARRIEAEKRLPKDLLYKKGWPEREPTLEEAELIAETRRLVAAAVGIQVRYTTGPEVLERFRELLASKRA